jgi:hypothetical protein
MMADNQEQRVCVKFRFLLGTVRKPGSARPCLCAIWTFYTYKDIRNFKHAQCNSLVMDTQSETCWRRNDKGLLHVLTGFNDILSENI